MKQSSKLLLIHQHVGMGKGNSIKTDTEENEVVGVPLGLQITYYKYVQRIKILSLKV